MLLYFLNILRVLDNRIFVHIYFYCFEHHKICFALSKANTFKRHSSKTKYCCYPCDFISINHCFYYSSGRFITFFCTHQECHCNVNVLQFSIGDSIHFCILHILPVISCQDAASIHYGRDKMAAISQTTFSNAFSWLRIIAVWFEFHWNFIWRVPFAIRHNWHR